LPTTQWILYELARNPVLQAELREEVYTAKDSPLDVLNKFLLLDAVLLETLRLHPAILENHHEVLPTLLMTMKLI
jgi:cytochrome P450